MFMKATLIYDTHTASAPTTRAEFITLAGLCREKWRAADAGAPARSIDTQPSNGNNGHRGEQEKQREQKKERKKGSGSRPVREKREDGAGRVSGTNQD